MIASLRLADATMRMRPGKLTCDGDEVAQFVEGEAVPEGERVAWWTVGVYRAAAARCLVKEAWLVQFDLKPFDRIWSLSGRR